MGYYVYEYLDEEGNVAYVGKTSKQISTRIKQHCSEIKFNGLTKVRYLECKTQKEMDNLEMLLISHLKPYINSEAAWHPYSWDTADYPSNYQWINYTDEITYAPSYQEIRQQKFNKTDIMQSYIETLDSFENLFEYGSSKNIFQDLIFLRKDMTNIIKEQLKNIRGF